MKKVLLAATIAASALFVSNNAQARPLPTSYGCMASCLNTVTADAGITAKTCNSLANDCTCEEIAIDYAGGRCTSIATTCPAGTSDWGATANGKKCCIATSGGACFSGGSGAEVEHEEVVSAGDMTIEKIFVPQNPHMVDEHYGFVSTTNRTGSTGRARASEAKLDVCLGGTDANTAKQNGNSWCQNTGCSTSYNEYCNANSGAVCKDRCECVTLGETDPACQFL
jgi:hypothetical protein